MKQQATVKFGAHQFIWKSHWTDGDLHILDTVRSLGLRLVDREPLDVQNRAHFAAMSARLMREILVDCDVDSLLIRVDAVGPGVCHEGYQSCFFRKLEGREWKESEPRVYDPEAVYGGKS